LPGDQGRSSQNCREEVRRTVDYAAQNIYFVTGSAKLQSKSFKGLKDVAAIMKNNPMMYLDIDGHTDNVGSDEFNQKLSDDRAAAVKAYMVSQGVEEDKLHAEGHGESTPVADNKTAAGRQKNRRVEMKLRYF
jgi:OmpA-OmpF porin, OOP family